MKIDEKTIQEIIKGASILGGGGGGKLDKAQELANQFSEPVNLIPLDSLAADRTVITCFGVGGLQKDGDVNKTIRNNLKVFQDSTGISVDAVIPVEVGPVSIVAAGLAAQLLGLPLIDADLVGFRAAPEVYLELITLGNLTRTPLVIGNDNGESLVLNSIEDLEKIEGVLRNFSRLSDSKTYVIGYPLEVSQLQKYSGKGSITECITLSKSKRSPELQREYSFVGESVIIKQEPLDLSGGFSAGKYELRALGGKATYTVLYKNENLVLLKDGDVLTTCPDNIMMIDIDSGYGINNGDENIGKQVSIVVSRSMDLWRTKRGLVLFSPKALGFNFEQVTL